MSVFERFTDGTHFEVQSTHVLASKPSFGPDQRLVSETEKATDLNLAKAEKVIEGQVVDLEGQPQLASEVDIVLENDKEKDRPLMFFHKGRELAAVIDTQTWQQDQSAIMTVTLLLCAKLTGRLVFPEGMDSTGGLVAGYGAIEEISHMSVGSQGQPIQSPPRKHLKYRFEKKSSYENDGTFSLILPANYYTSIFYGGGSVERIVLEIATLTPGQVRNLGDITLEQ